MYNNDYMTQDNIGVNQLPYCAPHIVVFVIALMPNIMHSVIQGLKHVVLPSVTVIAT